MRVVLVTVALGLALVGCVSPAQRIERKLVEVGLPYGMAECMGVRLAQQLTNNQLRQLDRLARLEGDRLARSRLEDIGRALGGVDDPALMGVVMRTGVGCLI